jgi:hypothetical protein
MNKDHCVEVLSLLVQRIHQVRSHLKEIILNDNKRCLILNVVFLKIQSWNLIV